MLQESETAPMSLVTSPQNFKKIAADLESGKKEMKKQLMDQNARMRSLRKNYMKNSVL